MNDLERLAPRKQPTQERALATVEAILDATAQVLVRRGYAKTTTNHIAEAAGVSIGTLYQYFPGKEAIVARLVERHAEGNMALLAQTVSEMEGAPLEVAARTLVKALLDVHARNPRLHQITKTELAQLRGLPRSHELLGQAQQILRAYLEQHRESLRPTDLDLAAFIIVRSVEATTHAVVLERPEMLCSEELLDEITTLVLRYVQVDP